MLLEICTIVTQKNGHMLPLFTEQSPNTKHNLTLSAIIPNHIMYRDKRNLDQTPKVSWAFLTIQQKKNKCHKTQP